MKKTILLSIGVALLLSGCALFTEAADKIADGVEKYCEQPYLYRSDFRNTINAQLTGTGHTVHVHCAGDPDVETSNTTEAEQWILSSESQKLFLAESAPQAPPKLSPVLQMRQLYGGGNTPLLVFSGSGLPYGLFLTRRSNEQG